MCPDVDDGGFADWYREYSGGEEVPTSYQEPQGSPSLEPSGDGDGGDGGGGTPGGSYEEGYVPGIISAEEYAEKYPEIKTVLGTGEGTLWGERASILSDVARDIIEKISSPGGVWAGFAEPGTPETSVESIATGTTVFWGWEWDPEKRKEMTFCELYPWHPSCWAGDGDGDGGGAPWFNLQFPSINIPGVGASDWSWLIWLALGGGVLLLLYKWATKKEVEIKYIEEH